MKFEQAKTYTIQCMGAGYKLEKKKEKPMI